MPNEMLLDVIACSWFIVTALGYQWASTRPSLFGRSISGGVQRHRLAWMRTMSTRENRAVDAILLGTLSQGNAFFASTSAIAIGGLAAIVGSGEKANAFLERIPYVVHTSPVLWEFKVLALMSVFVFAFFKFAWAFRLTHYTAIMIGAMPDGTTHNMVQREQHAQHAARLSGLAAEHSNSGLRSFYYAMALMAWFFHPLLFMAATTWILLILIRRDFFSRARATLFGLGTQD
jgi:uncharacterized membrane protein